MPTLVCDNYRVEHMEKHNRHIDELIPYSGRMRRTAPLFGRRQKASRIFCRNKRPMVIQYGSVATDYIHTVGSRKTEKENKEIYFSRKNQKNRLLRFPDCSRYCDNLYLSYRKGIQRLFRHNPYGSHLDPQIGSHSTRRHDSMAQQ